MNEDKYALCACGSGKRFKFCCYEKRSSLDGMSERELLRRAVEFRVSRCVINAGWSDTGNVHIMVVRQLPDLSYLLAAYLVDVFCLGVKNTLAVGRQKLRDVRHVLDDIPYRMEDIPYENARSIVLGAVAYARRLGFEPHEDWTLSSPAIESDRDFTNKFEFGKDGKPFYIQGPHDDVEAIMRRLAPLVETGDAHFLTVEELDSDGDAEKDFDDWCDEIAALLEDKSLEDASDEIARMREDYPGRWQPLFLMGTCLTLQGRPKEGIPLFEQALSIEPSCEAYYNLGNACKSLFQIDRWAECLRKVIELDGRGPYGRKAQTDLDELSSSLKKSSGITLETYLKANTMFKRAFADLRGGRFDRAVDGFTDLLKISPDHVQTYGNLGLAYAGLGRRDRAMACLDKAIELDPGYRPAIENRSAVLALKEGESLDLSGMSTIDFYGDRAREASDRTPTPIRVLSAAGR